MIPAIGRFSVEEVIGRGRNGVVYKAQDAALRRTVAIKVIEAHDVESRREVLASARSMAKLSHPAIVPVFDVGPIDEGVYIVMPLLRGGTLKQWLDAEPRAWQAVLDRFLVVGRGLAAAHAAGVAHGEFDARDVLLDGRDILIADLGLHRVEATPAADQLRYFEILDAALPQTAPSWLRAAVRRGRDNDEAAPWPSLTSFIDHVAKRRGRAPRVILIGAVATAVAGSAFIAIARPTAARKAQDPCGPSAARIEQVWNPKIRASVSSAFNANGTAVAADALARIVPTLDAYTNDWRTAAIAMCRAAAPSSGSPDLTDRAMACLDRRLATLRARAEAFATADRNLVNKAVELVSDLRPISDCTSKDSLVRVQPLPADPQARAVVAELERRIDEHRASELRADPVDLRENARKLVGEAARQPYLPVYSRALLEEVRAMGMVQEPVEMALRNLATVAARAGDDEVVAYAWIRLINELSQRGRIDEARHYAMVARALAQRTPSTANSRFELEMNLGSLAGNSGELEAATEHFRAALAASNKPVARAGALRNLSYSLFVRGKYDEAREAAMESVRLMAEVFGTNHPRYATALTYRSLSLQTSSDPADRRQLMADLENALAIHVQTFGENHPEVLDVLRDLSLQYINRGEWSTAETYLKRAEAILAHVDVPLARADVLASRAQMTEHDRGAREALPHYEKALAAAADVFGKETVDYADIEQAYASALVATYEWDRARKAAAHVLSVQETDGTANAGQAIFTLGLCLVGEGKRSAGLAMMERGLERCKKGCEPAAISHLESELAAIRDGRPVNAREK